MHHRAELELKVLPQPNDTTCGPTCLHAVYNYWEDPITLDKVIEEVPPLPGGGTLAVSLAIHALKRGYQADIYTYNLQMFDPTWFHPNPDLTARLKEQSRFKRAKKLHLATDAYLEFLRLGGNVHFKELTGARLRGFLKKELPILTGLSATYLYGCAREHNDSYDALRGEPMGHFVVLSGYDPASREVLVADPLQDNPGFQSRYYAVGIERLLGAIMLGIVTYDANLLILQPRQER